MMRSFRRLRRRGPTGGRPPIPPDQPIRPRILVDPAGASRSECGAAGRSPSRRHGRRSDADAREDRPLSSDCPLSRGVRSPSHARVDGGAHALWCDSRPARRRSRRRRQWCGSSSGARTSSRRYWVIARSPSGWRASGARNGMTNQREYLAARRAGIPFLYADRRRSGRIVVGDFPIRRVGTLGDNLLHRPVLWILIPRRPFAGAPGRNRTCDTRFRKPLLSPLSYEGVSFSS
jgi:hypothetical protein